MSERLMCKVKGYITLAVPERINKIGQEQTMLIADKEIRDALKAAGLLLFDERTPLDEIPADQKSKSGAIFSSVVGVEEARPKTRKDVEVSELPVKEVIK